MPIGPPCVAVCCTNPTRDSQYQYVDAADHTRGCVCKSGACRRWAGLARPKQAPGRKRRSRSEEQEAELAGGAIGCGLAARRIPPIISNVIEIKGMR